MSGYRLTRHKDGSRVDDGAQPSRLVALIEPRPDCKGSTMGWRFRPVTTMRGPQSKIWPSPEAALVGFGLMAKARAGFHGPYGTGISQLVNGIGGPEYIHALLTGYTGEEIEQAGTVLYQNTAFSSGNIAMPPPLSDDLVTYEDGTPATVDQMARDVSAFLMWTAEPKLTQRKQVGLVSVLFLIALTSLLYLSNKRLWAPHKRKLHHKP